MKKVIAVVGAVLLVLAMLTVTAAPVFAADSTTQAQPAGQGANLGQKILIMVRLLLVQDETKVDTFLANARAANKITDDQEAKIKDFWAKHHEQFTRRVVKRVILSRLMRAQDGTKVHTFLIRQSLPGRFLGKTPTQ